MSLVRFGITHGSRALARVVVMNFDPVGRRLIKSTLFLVDRAWIYIGVFIFHNSISILNLILLLGFALELLLGLGVEFGSGFGFGLDFGFDFVVVGCGSRHSLLLHLNLLHLFLFFRPFPANSPPFCSAPVV